MEFPGGLKVKDLSLSLLRHGFDPWPGNFCIPWEFFEKGKKKKGVPTGTQQIKDLALFLWQHWFHPGPGQWALPQL